MHKLLYQLGLCLIPFLSFAQTSNVSPFAYYGIGNLNVSTDVVQNSLGNAGFAYLDSSYLNFSNSSSYSRIASGYPLFSVGLNSTYSTFTTQGQSFSQNNIFIDHFVLAFPFANRFGLALGLKPFSKRNYSFFTREAISDLDTLNYQYDGRGSVSNAFGGLSIDLIKKERVRWSIGANAGHLFGQTVNQRISTLSGTSSGGVSYDSQRLKALQYDFATTLSFKISSTLNSTLTGFYEPEQKWGTTFGNELYFSTNVEFPTLFQTVDSSFYAGSINNAGSFGAGFMIDQFLKRTTRKNKELKSKIQYIGSYKYVPLSAMVMNVEDGQEQRPYTNDLLHVSFGIQVIPDNDFYANNLVGNFFNRLSYRVGFYSDRLPYSFNGEQYKQFGTTFGIGIPILSQFSYSSINIGVELGKRSNSQSGALNEQFVGLKFGVILSPSRADSWFRKVKLD
ncbi:MAG: hypothetical protein KJ941_08015 [Bacteroidetes bacterium]|nr:hypothetical protein [Bacteroidota bacterium]